MKKIINRKKYDTETAKRIGSYSNGVGYSDLAYFCEELYEKKTGEFFIYKEGGPMSHMGICRDGSIVGSENIIPVSENDAKNWVEEHLSVDEYESIFGEVEE